MTTIPFHRIHSAPHHIRSRYQYTNQYDDKENVQQQQQQHDIHVYHKDTSTSSTYKDLLNDIPPPLPTTTIPTSTSSSLTIPTSTSTTTSSLHINIPRMNSTPDCLVLSIHTPKQSYDEYTATSISTTTTTTPKSTRRASMPSTPSSHRHKTKTSQHFFPKDTSVTTTTATTTSTDTSLPIQTSIQTSTFTVMLTKFQPCAMSEAAQSACYRLPSLSEVISQQQQQTTRINRAIHPSLLPTMYRSASAPIRLRSLPQHRTASSVPCFPTNTASPTVGFLNINDSTMSSMWNEQQQDPYVSLQQSG